VTSEPSSSSPGGPAAAAGEPSTVAWFHCFAGIAGDMALGSLLDAGADLNEVLAILRRVPIDSWDLRQEEVLRGGVGCTRAVVSVHDDGSTRTHAEISGLVSEARLPERVARRALAVFAALAAVEGRIHRRHPEQVHFHEVGGHDAVVDVVGTAAALEVLGVDRIAASPVALGTGTVRTAHGLLPNPAPAVVRLLQGVPTYGRDTPVELTTPTGAALLAALCGTFGPMPPMEVSATGFGAGAAELAELPNCTQVVLGRSTDAASDASPDGGTGEGIGAGQPVTVLEANLDDATGEQLARAVAALLEAGAYDAWVTPIVMKKGRPAHTLHALCDPSLAGPLRRVFRSTTGTFGVRAVSGERWPGARVAGEVQVEGQPVRVKVGPGRVKPEFDDVDRVAALTGLPLHEVASRAEEAWRRDGDNGEGDRP
jgi:pyridinium-3,5-bisthiocarboxylic acid mononucleotide nickel chelatase